MRRQTGCQGTRACYAHLYVLDYVFRKWCVSTNRDWFDTAVLAIRTVYDPYNPNPPPNAAGAAHVAPVVANLAAHDQAAAAHFAARAQRINAGWAYDPHSIVLLEGVPLGAPGGGFGDGLYVYWVRSQNDPAVLYTVDLDIGLVE